MQEANIDARIFAVQQIGASLEQGYDDTPKIAAELLGHAIADENREVRENALYLFAEHKLLVSAESVEILRKHLRDGRGEIRRLAASSLGNVGAIAKDATVELIEALNDDDEWVGEEAAFALNSIGNSARSTLRNMENKAFAQRYNELFDGEGRSVEF